MPTKKSRLAEIYKSEKKIGGNVISTLGKRAREKFDPRNYFNQEGFLAAIAPSLFKSYTATPKRITETLKARPTINPTMASDAVEGLVDLKIDSKISAKNSMVLPSMARDMNLMRQNVVKLVKLQKGTPATKTDMFFKLASGRKADYESTIKKSKTPTPGPTKKSETTNEGSNTNSGSGSIIGGIFSGISSIVGGGVGLLSGAFKALGSLGFVGILAAIASASLLYSLYKGLNFTEIFGKIGDIVEIVGNSIKSFFGLASGSDDKNFFEIIATKLDSFFGTTAFTDGLNNITKKMDELLTTIEEKSTKLYVEILDGTIAALLTLQDVFKAVGQDMKSIFLKWMDDHETTFYTLAGTIAGTMIGKQFGGVKGAAAGALIGSAAGYAFGKTNEKLFTGEGTREENIAMVDKQISGGKARLAGFKTNNPDEIHPLFPGLKRKDVEEQIADAERRKQAIQKELDDRKGGNISNVNANDSFKKHLESRTIDASGRKSGFYDERLKTPSTSPTPASSNSTITFGSLTKEQQDVVLVEQRKREGFEPGKIAYDLNNPGNIKYGKFAKEYGGEPDTTNRGEGSHKGTFARFPTLAQGVEAQRALWLSSGYANLPLSQAINKWTTGKLEGTGDPGIENYKAGIFAAINKPAPAMGTTKLETAKVEKEKVPKIPEPTISGTILAALTGDYQSLAQDIKKEMAPIINNITNNNVASGGGQSNQGTPNIPSAFDDAFNKLFARIS